MTYCSRCVKHIYNVCARSYCVSIFNWFFIKQNILTYCVKCRRKPENVDSKIFKTKSGRLIMQSKYAKCEI